MIRRVAAAVTVVAAAAAAVVAVASAQATRSPSPPVHEPWFHKVGAGEVSWRFVADAIIAEVGCPAASPADAWAFAAKVRTYSRITDPGAPIYVGMGVSYDPDDVPCDGADPVPSTVPPTSAGPEPTAPPATVPPTDPPTTTTEPPTTTTEPPVPGVQFFEDFATPEGLYERFEGDVHFRANDYDRAASFHGDHSMACENPNVSARTVHVPDDDGQDLSAEVFYHCIPNGNPAAGHFMTAMGPAGFGYSVLSLRPLQTFHDVTKVCIDASNTQLGGDVWWELSVVPKDDFDANGGRLDYITAQAVGIDDTGLDFPDEAFVYQLWDNKIRTYQGMDETLFDWFEWSTTDRAPRYQHCLTDNGDGTVTIDRAVATPNCCEPDGVRTVTVDGSFPAGESVVLIQHSTYDPPKHGSGPNQTTIHWDNLLVE